MPFVISGRVKALSAILGMFILLCFMAITCGCASQNELNKSKDELAKVKAEFDKTKARLDVIEKENTRLKDENQKMIDEVGALRRRMTDAGIAETPEVANFDACKENLKKIAQAIKLYAADNAGVSPKKLSKIFMNSKYLEVIPTCPAATKDTYSDGYEVSNDKKSFTVYCCGKNHINIKVKPDYPQYSSTGGMLVEKQEANKPDDE
jgi:cell division protein FtsB